jgi:hypothetical protein
MLNGVSRTCVSSSRQMLGHYFGLDHPSTSHILSYSLSTNFGVSGCPSINSKMAFEIEYQPGRF